jgi:prophage regulatory protein
MSNNSVGNPIAVEKRNPPIVFISRHEVERITNMSRSWIYQAMAENRFPQSVQCSASSVRWVLSEVQAWMEDKIRARDSKLVKTA